MRKLLLAASAVIALATGGTAASAQTLNGWTMIDNDPRGAMSVHVPTMQRWINALNDRSRMFWLRAVAPNGTRNL
jgi:hypothetical protein